MSALVEQIDALLALNAKGAVSHPVPGLAVELLERARNELAALPASDHAGLASRVFYPVNNPSAWPDGFNQNISDLLREAATALSAGVGATVKPLVWVDESWTGRPLINYGYGYNPCRGHFTYTIEPSRDEEKGEGFFVSVFLMHPFVVASVAWRRDLVEAKAAAQADYEARVLAQLAEALRNG